MSSNITHVHTARKAHECQSGSCETVIARGHRYLVHVAFPGSADNQTSQPIKVKECVACAANRDTYTPHEAGACGTYCCGTTPCALPFEHGCPPHTHSCSRCASTPSTAEAGAAGGAPCLIP